MFVITELFFFFFLTKSITYYWCKQKNKITKSEPADLLLKKLVKRPGLGKKTRDGQVTPAVVSVSLKMWENTLRGADWWLAIKQDRKETPVTSCTAALATSAQLLGGVGWPHLCRQSWALGGQWIFRVV